VASEGTERRLAAIMFTDIVGYTALMAESEERGLRARERHREVVRPLVEQHHGESIEARGDESLSVFPTALDAVRCALAIQERAEGDPELSLHLGIHLGDVVVQAGEVSGDGVNIASRICSLSEGGGLCVSGEIYQAVRNQPDIEAVSLGERALKNVGRRVAVYAVGRPGVVSASRPPVSRVRSRRVRWMALAAGVAIVLGVGAWQLWESEPARSPSPGADLESTAGDEAFTVPGFGGAPAIAVLAFDNLSDDPSQEYFSDGISEDLITRLSSAGSFPVISRNSSFAYKGQAVDMKQVGRALGARYVIEGSVRKAGSRVRISAQLIDTAADHHVWAETYDRELNDIFAVQDEIAESILRSIRPELYRTERERAARREPTEFGAYDLVMRADWHAVKGTPQDAAKARSLCEEAIELDPSYAPAWTLLAVLHWADLTMQWTDSPAESLEELKRAARKSVALDASRAQSHLALAQFYQVTAQTEEQIAALEQAVSLDPSLSGAHRDLGAALVSTMGSSEEGLGHLNQALRLDPKSLTTWITLIYISGAHWSAGRYEVALDHARQAVRLNPDSDVVQRTLALSYVGLGRLGEARAAIDEALRISPDLTQAVVREQLRRVNADPDLAERWLEGLRKAGLPEE
jgi:adenylate cyclase